MIYITGDTHGEYQRIYDFCIKNKTTKKDIMIILGDSGINYFLNERDYLLKKCLNDFPITFFCIHGNHEERPENIEGYIKKDFMEGEVFYEKHFPNILFGIDGEVYNFNNQKTLVIGGAYSIDKIYRLMHGYNWYASEQPSIETKEKVLNKLKSLDHKIDIILSHTCPYKYLPYEVFLSGVNQENVDHKTEEFLSKIEENNKYQKWYCGHFHTDKVVDKIRFMFNDIDEFK